MEYHEYEVYGSQTLQYVAGRYEVPASVICRDLQVPEDQAGQKLGWLRKQYSFTMNDVEMVPSGIPYIFGTLDCSDQNLMPVDTKLGKAGIESIVDEVVTINKEAKTAELGGGETIQLVNLIAALQSGVIIRGEVIGGLSAGELTNVIGLAIQNRMSVNSLLTSQIGTHPCLTASPAGYPLIKAAELIAGKMRNR